MNKVLIVDDDTVLARLYKSVLESENFEVDTAFDGEEGFTKAKEFKPDLILSDVMMPRVTGLEMLKNLKADSQTKNIKVIVMTNLKDDENAKIASQLGALSFIIKNEQNPKEVVEIIKKYLGGNTK